MSPGARAGGPLPPARTAPAVGEAAYAPVLGERPQPAGEAGDRDEADQEREQREEDHNAEEEHRLGVHDLVGRDARGPADQALRRVLQAQHQGGGADRGADQPAGPVGERVDALLEPVQVLPDLPFQVLQVAYGDHFHIVPPHRFDKPPDTVMQNVIVGRRGDHVLPPFHLPTADREPFRQHRLRVPLDAPQNGPPHGEKFEELGAVGVVHVHVRHEVAILGHGECVAFREVPDRLPLPRPEVDGQWLLRRVSVRDEPLRQRAVVVE
ncbi:MAG: hypothetical protein GEV11_27875 [Streptosporangiales bacterium]|nr:hypothetical protein [Streptosporangiales bacterium]